MIKRLSFLVLTMFFVVSAQAQSTNQVVSTYLQNNTKKLDVTDADIENFVILSDYITAKTGLQHVAIQQTFNGVPLIQSTSTVTIKDDAVIYFGNRLKSQIANSTSVISPSLSKEDAIVGAAEALNLTSPSNLQLIEDQNGIALFNTGNISLENIPVKLVYETKDDSSHILAYDLSIHTLDNKHWWSLRIDASNGELLSKNDWIVSCDFGHNHESASKVLNTKIEASSFGEKPQSLMVDGSQYNVYPLPVESPIHGARALVSEPANTVASPFGWHDTNGVAGPEETTTVGNNVLAEEDRDGENGTSGFRPDGGAALSFDYNVDLSNQPIEYEEAAITNLFYWNNLMHDIWYQYGFDEASGNFQENNYGNGGVASDRVNADAQDGNGQGASINNATFGTPPDGGNPSMTMFLWSPISTGLPLTINSPSGLAGDYLATLAQFGPALPNEPIVADFTLMVGGFDNLNDGCDPANNPGEINNTIAIARRGECNFTVKVKNAQNAGALAVIIVNNVPGDPIAMGGTDNTITIPSVMVSDVDGEAIINALNSGMSVNGQLEGDPQPNIDGDFDNGIIAHEYGHGISTRLTGGPNVANCLFNADQMGEGWSDYFGLMVTMEPGDLGSDVRGIGTYVIGQTTTGGGIRPAPYSTDLSVNSFTYGSTNLTSSISEPHGIGFVWATMIWDMTWALIDQYGYDNDIYNGTGGNNIAMQLVMDGLKIQACNPGFVDGRDAILAADMANNGGANQCLIYQAFADRGLGFSAVQGNTNNRTDQIEAFDMPPVDQLDCSLSVDEINTALFNVYPNPADNTLNINIARNSYTSITASLYDVQGREILNTKLLSSNIIDISNVQSGIYILNINADNKVFSEKIIIE